MPWKQFDFRGEPVFVRILERPDGTDKPIVRRGLVEFRYKLGARKSYHTQRENIEAREEAERVTDEQMSGGSRPARADQLREQPKTAETEETIIAYTDGACSGNPGPAGVGVFLTLPDSIVSLSEFMGLATNNAAELTAILRALEAIPDEHVGRSMHLYTDSAWCLGVLIGGWKAKTNLKLIEKVREQMVRFEALELLKVRGHAGVDGNEEADALATRAVRREETSEPRIRARKR
jgi:ribonuclease HI